MRTKESESGRRRFFAWGASPPLSDLGNLLLTTETTPKNKDERIIIMKKLILPKTDIIGSGQRASLAGWLNMPLTFSLMFLGFSSAIACDETCEPYPIFNTAFGAQSLENNTTGISDTAIGYFALGSNSTGSGNTGVGDGALGLITTGNGNTAVGSNCLACSTASFNTAVGEKVMFGNDGPPTVGDYNTGVGFEALSFTSGSYNTALGPFAIAGDQALLGNNFGSNNTGIGSFALFKNSGSFNTAIGDGALEFNSTGQYNTASGLQAMYGDATNLSTGSNNTVSGYAALFSYTSGSNNTANGYQALNNNTSGGDNTACGKQALLNNTTGGNNIAIGSSAGKNLTGSNNIDIGAYGTAGDANTIRLGKSGLQSTTYIVGINGVTVARGVGVVIDSNNHLGTVTSSARYKENIQPMDKASEAILSLQPVTFRYKKALDPQAIPQFGLVAEQVEKVDPQLVAYDEQGKAYSVRYEAVNAMLLNEFLKEHRKVEEQARKMESLERAVVAQEKENEAMRAMLRQQAAQIQNVSEQLAITPPSTRLVVSRGTRSVPSLDAIPSASKSAITK